MGVRAADLCAVYNVIRALLAVFVLSEVALCGCRKISDTLATAVGAAFAAAAGASSPSSSAAAPRCRPAKHTRDSGPPPAKKKCKQFQFLQY